MKAKFLAVLGLLAGLLPFQASASSVSFMGSGTNAGVNVSAYALFNLSADGKTLTITLKNTSAATPGSPMDVPSSTLTGLFWNSPTSAVLTPWSASATSIVLPTNCINPASCSGGNVNVGGEFGYQNSGYGGSSGTNKGIAAAGYVTTGLSGNIGNFANNGTTGGLAGTNLYGTASLGGIDFGIISSAYALNPNGGVLSTSPLVKDAVTFVLTSSVALTTADIANVTFTYGTSGGEFSTTTTKVVPEPGTLALLGIGLAGVMAGKRRKAKAERAVLQAA